MKWEKTHVPYNIEPQTPKFLSEQVSNLRKKVGESSRKQKTLKKKFDYHMDQ